jgi:type III secretory pathway component EscR
LPCYQGLFTPLFVVKMRFILIILIALFAGTPVYSQNDDMMQGKRKQKKIWRKWRRKKGKGDQPYNPYLQKKDKDKVSRRLAKGQKREIRRQRREYKKQLKKGKKKISD